MYVYLLNKVARILVYFIFTDESISKFLYGILINY